jgi:cytochrome P450 / NADPH-cytochrome P450 reductase
MFTDFEAWEDEVFWPTMAQTFNVQGEDHIFSIPSLDLKITTPRTTALRQDVDEASVVAIKDLTQPGAAPKKHIEIQLPIDATYRAGDYLAVLPMNDTSNVKRVMRRFHLPWDSHVTIPAGRSHTTLPTDKSIAVSDLLSAYVELEQPATKKVGLLSNYMR